MDEVWKDVIGFGGHYMASSFGRIMTKRREVVRKNPSSGAMCVFVYKARILSPTKSDKYGHLTVHIGVDGKKSVVGIHRLVLLAFTGPPLDGQEACHNDGNAGNNRPENLRWDTHYNNNRDRHRHGRYATGERHPMAKFSDELIAKIRADGTGYAEAAKQYGISRTHAHRLFVKNIRRTA